MKVFVTGGNGFIGSRVVRRLCEAGHEVTCLLRSTSKTERIDDLEFARHIGDVRDSDSLRAGVQGKDACIHLASVSAWGDMRSDALEAIVVDGTRHLLDACKEVADLRLVYISSAIAINGSASPRVFDEESPFELADASMPYAHAKHVAEQLVLEHVAKGLDAVIVNPAEVYGPDDTSMVTAGNLVDALKSWPALACHGGTAVTHVDDVAAGIVAALESGRAGERYILGGDNLSVKELLELTLRIAGQKKPVVTLPNRPLKWAVNTLTRFGLPSPVAPEVLDYATFYFFVDSAKAMRELGYNPRPAREVLAPVVGWLKAAGHIP